jgi:hypothetical protein
MKRIKISGATVPLMQHRKGLFQEQYQSLSTSSLSAAGSQNRNIFAARFFNEKNPPRRHG